MSGAHRPERERNLEDLVERLRALHLTPRGQHTRRPRPADQQATTNTHMNTEPEGITDDAGEP